MATFLFNKPASANDRTVPLRRALMVPAIAQVEKFSERFDCKIATAYGSTEASTPLYTAFGEAQYGTCGTLRPDFEARLVDAVADQVQARRRLEPVGHRKGVVLGALEQEVIAPRRRPGLGRNECACSTGVSPRADATHQRAPRCSAPARVVHEVDAGSYVTHECAKSRCAYVANVRHGVTSDDST